MSEHRDHDLESVLARLQTWSCEASNFRNDGWIAEGNRKRVEAVALRAAELLKELNKNTETRAKHEENVV
jgi:hypothetical protein